MTPAQPDLVKMLLQLGETTHHVRVGSFPDGAVRAHRDVGGCSRNVQQQRSLHGLVTALWCASEGDTSDVFSPTVGDSTALERQMGVALPLVKRLWSIDPTFVLRACREHTLPTQPWWPSSTSFDLSDWWKAAARRSWR